MILRGWLTWSLLLTAVILLNSCAHHRSISPSEFQCGESLVLVSENPVSLAFAPILSRSFTLRSTYRDGLPQTIHYEPGRDYLLEASGQIRRARNSRIPDFSTNILYGKEDFRHDQFPGFGNGAFFVYADYFHRETWMAPIPQPELSATRLPMTRQKLLSGKKVRLVAFGDSITAGGDASEPSLIYWERWADSLRKQYPKAAIESLNGATGGDSTVQGLQRLQEKVLRHQPDLVLVAFGMNDHNREGYGVPLQAFTENLGTLVDRIQAAGAEVVLVSAFPPNPKWHFGSHNMAAYANATKQVAREKHCALADVYPLWTSCAAHKKPEDLLGNNINHPNDFGHYLYFRALQALGL
jgi:acyl-CoA thioesterase I